MASNTIKVRAKLSDGITTVKALMTHPMETGARKDEKSGQPIPAHFIQEVTCAHNGKEVLTTQWSGGVSKNPYLSFELEGGAKGDTISLQWKDNLGETDSVETTIE